jgi:hypothetical protein
VTRISIEVIEQMYCQNTKISVDAPKYFLDPYQTAKKCGISDSNANSRSRESFCRTLAKGSRYQSPFESSYVLPGGSSILEATIKSKEINSRSTYRLYSGGKFVSLKPFFLIFCEITFTQGLFG